MTKEELLVKYPNATAFQDSNKEWHIWAAKGVKWLGFGNTEQEAWDFACQESVF